MGKWYGIATASTCPWLKRHKGEASIGSIVLQQSSESTQTISMTRIGLRYHMQETIITLHQRNNATSV